MFSPSHRPPKHELEPLFNERVRVVLRFAASACALAEGFVEANRGSHMSDHTLRYVYMSPDMLESVGSTSGASGHARQQ